MATIMREWHEIEYSFNYNRGVAAILMKRCIFLNNGIKK